MTDESSASSQDPEESPPVDHFQKLRPQATVPPVASIAARSLPVLGLLGILVTIALGVGAARGELPYVGVISDANLAWAAMLVTISIWAVYLLWKVPRWQAAAWARTGNANPRELFEIENQSRGTLGQILSGVAVLTGLIFAWQQLGQTSDNLRVSTEGQITDRFTTAVDQLGSDALTVRLGGIYALERIARDSPRDYGPVMEVLTAFAREQSPLPAGAAATPVALSMNVPEEVRAVFKVIGRRTDDQIEKEITAGGCLDLTDINAVGVNLIGADLRNTCWDRSDLRGAQLMRANLTGSSFAGSNLSQQANLDSVSAAGIILSDANLSQSNLANADLHQANLLSADLSLAQLPGADLSGTQLVGADLQTAIAFGTNFSNADFAGANLAGAVFSGANLSGAEHLTPDQLAVAVVDDTTIRPVPSPGN
ncbi:MAG: pentapeptide repeat-containing protein [Thermomicrobiales bacterium]